MIECQNSSKKLILRRRLTVAVQIESHVTSIFQGIPEKKFSFNFQALELCCKHVMQGFKFQKIPKGLYHSLRISKILNNYHIAILYNKKKNLVLN